LAPSVDLLGSLIVTNEHDCAALTSMDFLLEFLESHKFAELTIETNAHQDARKQNLYA